MYQKHPKTPSNPFRHLVSATPKTTENPSGATAIFVDRVHRGPRREQQLDHSGLAIPSRIMQRSLASGARDATGTAAAAGCRGETKRLSWDFSSGSLGKMWIGHK